MGMNVSDEMIEQALAERFRVGDGPAAVDVVSAGRRRARRQRTARVASLASATALVAAVAVGGAGVLGYDLSGAAPGNGGGITACSAEPTTCSAAEVENWVYRATGARAVLPAADPTINPFEHPVGLPGDVSVYRTLYTDDVSIDLVLSPGQSVRTLFRGIHADPQASSAVPGYPGLTKFTSRRGGAPGTIDYTAWGAEARTGAGSVLVVYAGPDSHKPNDRDVAELIRGLRGE